MSSKAVKKKIHLNIDIAYECEDWRVAIPDANAIVADVALHTLNGAGFEGDDAELSFVLADNDFVQALNKTYRDQDKPTNVLSFPQDDGYMLGDVILAFETLASEAEDQSKALTDHFKHLICHGVLHLLGFDHIEDVEAEEMESLEVKILHALDVKNPYTHGESVA